jgi:hypothetical protein
LTGRCEFNTKPTFLSEIILPGAAALATGVFVGILAACICLLTGQPGEYALLAGAGAALLGWLARPALGLTPKAPKEPERVEVYEQKIRLEIQNLDAKQADFLGLDIDPERLAKFAAGLTSGMKLDSRTWSGKSRLFSQTEFAALRSALLAAGLVRWVSDRDVRSGCELTNKGRAVMSGLAPLPEIEKSGIMRMSRGIDTQPHAHRRGEGQKVTF